MTSSELLRSTHGRLFTALVASATLGAALLAFVPPGPVSLRLLVFVPLVNVVLGISAVGLAVNRSPGWAASLAIGLPFAGFLYFGLVSKLAGAGAPAGVPLLVLGLLATAITIRPARLAEKGARHETATA